MTSTKRYGVAFDAICREWDFQEDMYADLMIELTEAELDLILAARNAWMHAQLLLEEKIRAQR